MCHASSRDIFFMYLSQLYKHSKFWFVVVLLFIIIQLTLSIRRDASVTPFYQYGMYSEVIKPQKVYIIPVIKVNGNMLQTKNFTCEQWDKIVQPVVLYDKQEDWNAKLFTQHIQPLFTFTDENHYRNNLSKEDFYRWYKNYLAKMLQQPIDSLVINFDITAYTNKTLQPAH